MDESITIHDAVYYPCLQHACTLSHPGKPFYGWTSTQRNDHLSARSDSVVNLFWSCVGFTLVDQSQPLLLRCIDARLQFL